MLFMKQLKNYCKVLKFGTPCSVSPRLEKGHGAAEQKKGTFSTVKGFLKGSVTLFVLQLIIDLKRMSFQGNNH